MELLIDELIKNFIQLLIDEHTKKLMEKLIDELIKKFMQHELMQHYLTLNGRVQTGAISELRRCSS